MPLFIYCGPNAAFDLIFLGLGWPWVGEFVGFIIRWYWSTNSFVPFVAHSACALWQHRRSALHFFSVRVYQACKQSSFTHCNVEKMSWILPKLPGFGMNGLYTITHYIWLCIPLDECFRIPSLVLYGFVYHHSLYMVLYTIVWMVLFTTTRYVWLCIPLYTWFCIPSPVIHGSVYQCMNGIVYHHRYNRFVFDDYVNSTPRTCKCRRNIHTTSNWHIVLSIWLIL